MRYPFSLFVLLTTGAIQAQTYQEFDLHPKSTSFSSRGSLGVRKGELLQGVHASTFRGVMDVDGTCRISQMGVITQDENCATQETFNYVVRSGNDTNGPNGTSGGILGSIQGINTPATAVNVSCGWILSTTLTAAAAIQVPKDEHWSFGIQLPASPGWNTGVDGQSVHASRGACGSPPLHNSHSRQEDQAWQIIDSATTAVHPTECRSWRFSSYVLDGVVMNLGCGDAYGYGGSFPIASTATAPLAWDARIDGGTDRAGFASALAIGASRANLGRFGVGAHLYVNGPYFVAFGPPADVLGVATVPVLPFVPANAAGAGTFYVQGLLADPVTGNIHLANSQSITP